MEQEPPEADVELWQRFVETHAAVSWARHQLFVSSKPCLPILVKRGLANPVEVEAALNVKGLLDMIAPWPALRDPDEEDLALWTRFVRAHAVAVEARYELLEKSTTLVQSVRGGLNAPGSPRLAALDLTGDLSIARRIELIADLLGLASYFHRETHKAQQAIVSLPKPWLLENLEVHSEPFLREASYEEFSALLDLALMVDPELAHRFADHARTSRDPEIREDYEEFLSRVESARLASNPQSS